jgi:hypothetical protein
MRHIKRLIVSASICLSLYSPAMAQEQAATPPQAPPQVTEITRLKVENHMLRLALAQANQKMAESLLNEERQSLERVLSSEAPGFKMDWQTGQLVPVVAQTPNVPKTITP